MSIKLLDCTLREAPIKDLIIGKDYIQKFIYGLEKSNIDIIECGFLKNEGSKDDNTIFNKVEEIETYLKNKKPDKLYVALVDYGRYDLKYLSPYDGKSIDGIRVCFKKHESKEVMQYAKGIKAKGYKVFLQHVDTISYSDLELIEFIQDVNELEPYSYAIVDTFGSMYADDLRHIWEIVNKNVKPTINIGFHAHNNLMLAVANSQFFISLADNKRNFVVDGSVLGCGRGAGNANTELLAQYINDKQGERYNLDELLDIIDVLMPRFLSAAKWGYSIPYFLSGVHNSHVFNVNHLLRRHNIKSKDLRKIIEKLDDKQKKAYDYKLLEKLYVEHFNNEIDDSENIEKLKNITSNRKILILCPGASILENRGKIYKYIEKEKPYIISVNNIIDIFNTDAVFFSSTNRYHDYMEKENNINKELIITTSNIKTEPFKNELIINYMSLVKFGWINIDNATILLLRLLVKTGHRDFVFAGFDGFNPVSEKNYFNKNLITQTDENDLIVLTKEVREMLSDLISTNKITGSFLTKSMYGDLFSLREETTLNV